MSVGEDEARAQLLVSVRPSVYAGLCAGDPLDGGSELDFEGYHRVLVDFSEPQDDADVAYADNTDALHFGTLPSGAEITVTFALLADTAAGDSIRRTAPLVRPVMIREFEEPSVPAGSLRVAVPMGQ